jgi:hypothetical protein
MIHSLLARWRVMLIAVLVTAFAVSVGALTLQAKQGRAEASTGYVQACDLSYSGGPVLLYGEERWMGNRVIYPGQCVGTSYGSSTIWEPAGFWVAPGHTMQYRFHVWGASPAPWNWVGSGWHSTYLGYYNPNNYTVEYVSH